MESIGEAIFRVLKELLENNSLRQFEKFAFFLGYSGWTEEQLLERDKYDSWFVSENDLTIFLQKTIDTLEKQIVAKRRCLQTLGKCS